MFSSLQINNPMALWLLVLVLPIVFAARWYLQDTERVRRWVITLMRVGLLILLVALLGDLRWVERSDRLTVIGVVDTSGSVRQLAELPLDAREVVLRDNLDFLADWMQRATANKRPDDRVGLIGFDGKPIAFATPTTGEADYSGIDQEQFEGTNIAEALRYALAMIPPDSAGRVVLMTDGNETAGDALAAVRELSGGGGVGGGGGGGGSSVPIDLVPIEYAGAKEVLIERVEVPRFGRPDQRVTVRIVLRSSGEAVGRLRLKMEDVAVDLNGAEREGVSRVVQLAAGLNVVTAEVDLGKAAVQRFEATFEALDGGVDTIASNNVAEAFTITPQRGSVLIADGVYEGRGHFLGESLEDAGLSVKVVGAAGLPSSLVELQAYDLVILQNVAEEDVAKETQESLVRYVNDLGGGLLMVGGFDSFGAGHWEESAVAEMLPVSLEVPEEMHVPTAAIALVLDRSGSMNYPVLGTRRTKQEIANEGAAVAIEALDKHDYVAVYSFSYSTNTVVELQRASDPKAIADRVRGIKAGGGTDIMPALKRAFAALRNVDAEIKHVVCLSDGQSEGEGFGELAEQMKAAGISVSAIAVGEDADEWSMKEIAEGGGGRYYFVRNPQILPRIFVKEIRVMRRALIREVDFQPILPTTNSGVLAGLESAGAIPELHGLVLTRALEEDATAHLLMVSPAGEPVLAYKQQGLGRTGAFTSDAHDLWAKEWLDWEGFDQLWIAVARAVARAPGNREFELQTSFEDGRFVIRMLDSGEKDEEGGGNELGVEGVEFPLVVPGFVYTPDGVALPVRLRQTGPGFYEASVAAEGSGNYVVALTPQQGNRQLGLVLGGTSRPTGLEFRALMSNTARLAAQVRESGGRVLDMHAAEVVDLFDPATVPEALSLVPLWPILIWWALGLFIVDVGMRRIAWDGELIRLWVLETLIRVRLAPRRAEAAAATLQGLREKGLSIAPVGAGVGGVRGGDEGARTSRGDEVMARKDFVRREVAKTVKKDEAVEVEVVDEDVVAAARQEGLAALRGRRSGVASARDEGSGTAASADGEVADDVTAEELGEVSDDDSGANESKSGDEEGGGSAIGKLAAARRARRNQGAGE